MSEPDRGTDVLEASWWCLQHEDHEGPASIADAFGARGIDLRVLRIDEGEPLPPVDAIAGLVVMGGTMGAFDDDEYPWLAAERALIAECVRRKVSLLGVCLGAQLLAGALGARVYRGPHGEVGAGTVTFTEAAREDVVLGAAAGEDPMPVVHWHHDTFDLPDDAVLLASSERYAHQAFRVGDRAYGLQFHVELGPRDLPKLREHMNPTRVPTEEELVAVETRGRVVLDGLAALFTRA